MFENMMRFGQHLEVYRTA